MTISKNGTFDSDSKDEILDAMVADAKEYWGEDLKDNEEAAVRIFYEPIAELFAVAQDDIAEVLASSQIDHATGGALDLLTALIGVSRREAVQAEGTVTFYFDSDTTTPADQDYTISSGTTVQTNSDDPVSFETTETVTLQEGNASVDAPVLAVNGGTRGNVGSNTIVVIPDPPLGTQAVTNSAATSKGREAETDDELRDRAKTELAQGSRASAPALVNSVSNLNNVNNISIFINDTNSDNTGSGGLPDHSFELVVAGGNTADIAQAILDTKAAGDTSYAGANGNATSGTADLPNGQDLEIEFSRPVEIQIYVDIGIEVTDEYDGDEAIQDEIVDYLGGILNSGNSTTGLGVSDDVIYGEIEYAIRNIEGVYDVTNLEVGTTSSPTGTSNVAISSSEVAFGDATDSSITITTTTV